MVQKRKNEHITDVYLSDIPHHALDEHLIKYNDEELVIIENLRDIPDLANPKIAFNVVALCVSGRMELDVSGCSVVLRSQQLIICQRNALLSGIMVSPDFDCKIMCISDHLLHSVLSAQMLVWDKLLFREKCFILDVPDNRFGLYNELQRQWSNRGGSLKHEIITSLLRVVFLQICQMLIDHQEKQSAMTTENTSRMDMLFHRFIDNVAKRKVKKQPVGKYADELFISPKYLSTVCRMVSDKSPIAWIKEYVLEDIVFYLRNTDLTVSRIAVELGFPNVSFFCKYVREHLGMSPNDYRKKLLSSNQ